MCSRYNKHELHFHMGEFIKTVFKSVKIQPFGRFV